MSMIYLKGSFEDEGLSDFETRILSSMARDYDLPLAFKIGGCEAKSDIIRALDYGSKCIVAPMIESKFAAEKFISATSAYTSLFKEVNVNIETETAVSKVNNILKDNHKFLTGVVVGRTDLCLSLGKSRKNVDSKQIMKMVEETLVVAKSYDLTTTMGGSVSLNSIPNIIDMFQKNLLDRFETRKVIMHATDNEAELRILLQKAFEIESEFLKKTLDVYSNGQKQSFLRISAIESRRHM